jgi:hypothetical protein
MSNFLIYQDLIRFLIYVASSKIFIFLKILCCLFVVFLYVLIMFNIIVSQKIILLA